MPNYDKLRLDFTDKAVNIFKNNTQDYTPNDMAFLHGLNEMFGTAMSAKGLNVLDPIYANFFHYNKTGMQGNTDIPRVTRTYVFFTRPELNFSFENLNATPFFKWLYSKRIGKMIMASLTDPNYFVNGPAGLSNSNLTTSQIREISDEFQKTMKELEKQYMSDYRSSGGQISMELESVLTSDSNSDTNTVYSNADLSAEGLANALASDAEKAAAAGELGDDPAEVARLQGLDFSSIYDSTSLDNLGSDFESAQAAFSNFIVNYDNQMHALGAKFANAFNVMTGDEIKADLRRRGLVQAKDLFADTHNSELDKFNFTSPFIPLLGNTCTSVTGAKDLNLNEFNYEEDEFGATMSVPTGMDEIWSGGTLSTSFEDIPYGPVSLMLMVWELYIHYVSRGFIMTTREHITERILDYTCSIYVFLVGEDGKRIERWAKYTGCTPQTFPLSTQLEHNRNVEQDVLHKITISWKYNRFEFMDPQIFTDFNFLSESEWLVKLRDPFWESLYNRHARPDAADYDFLDLTKAKTEEDRMMLNKLGRSSSLWTVIDPKDRGMSGKLPTALIEPMGEFQGGDSWRSKTVNERFYYKSLIDSMNNVWGGYPYINRGSDFIWVLPQFGTKQNVTRDRFNKDGTSVENKDLEFNSDNRPEKNKTGFEQHAVIKEANEPDIDPNAHYFIGNATIV